MNNTLWTGSRSILVSFGMVCLGLTIAAPAIAEPEITPETPSIRGVGQRSDVQPTDWGWQALQSLVEISGCLEGYPDGSFQGNQALTRDEFAVSLAACLDAIAQQPSGDIVPISDEAWAVMQRLQAEFAAELALIQSRIDTLEANVAELRAQPFSTTTRLTGQALFALNAGGFGGDMMVGPTGAAIANDQPNPTLIYRAVLDFNTSFSGTDLLKIRVDTGSGGPRDNTAGFLEPTFGSGLDFSAKPPSDGDFGIGRLFYTFTPGPDLTVSIGPSIRTTDYIDRSRYANLSFRDFSTQALVNNYILFPINGPSAGAAVDWSPGNGAFTVRALYAAADAANPGDTGIIRGTAPFLSWLYPINGNPATADLGDRGLFSDTYQTSVELEYAPAPTFAVRLQYSGGEIYGNGFDVVGLNTEVSLAENIGIFGRYGYGSYTNTPFETVNPSYWMAGIAVQDVFAEGAIAGIAMGQPFIESALGNGTQTNFEAFYNFPVRQNIRITPLIQVISNPSNQTGNGTVVTGTLRTVFLF
ncbi:iron uptake porin [Halomicronema sp. CCY15110]|uniref:iron uptake porin n=1 Tax=Halomicronema sp. CCY15110 TaxID=2767773 RepID=UPI00195143B3|nr:iron uptake porin [Halomicronema sp. CCY15110]